MIEQHKTLSEKFLKKGFWLYLFSFIIAPIGYIIKIIVSGNISVSDLGVLYGVLSLITLLSSFNDFGMTDSLNYFIPKYTIKKDYSKVKTILFYAFLTQFITGVIIAFIMYFGADFLAQNYFKTPETKTIIQIFCLYFLGINIFQVFNTFFLVIQNTFYNRITEFLRIIFILLSIIFIVYSGYSSLSNFAFSWVSGLYFGIIFVIYFFYKEYYKKYFLGISFSFSKKLFKKLFSYAITVFLAAQASTLLSQVDMQMIIFLLDTTQAGYYSNYLSIITIPFMIIGPIFGLLFPIFSELYAKKDFEKIKLIKKLMQKNFIGVALAFNILFFVFAPIIAYVLFGEKYIESGNILRYSILFLVFNFLLQINFNILAGIGKVKERLKIISIALIFNLILNILFIKIIGVYGAALATGLGWILIWILSEIKLGKKYKTIFDYNFLIKNIILLGIFGIFLYYFINPLFEGLSRGISFGLLSLIGVFWFLIFGLINLKEFKGFILEVKRVKKG